MYGPIKMQGAVTSTRPAQDPTPAASAFPVLPRLAVGGVVIHDGKVLLVRRNKAPAKGQWAIPGGRVEPGETMAEAVVRELLEETSVKVQPGDICYLFESLVKNPDGGLLFHYVIVDFWAPYVSGRPVPGSDVSAAAWVSAAEIPDFFVNESTLGLLEKLDFI